MAITRKWRTRTLAPLAALACVFAVVTSALAYGPQVTTTITVTPSSITFVCGHPESVEATVLDQDGLPIKGVVVAWTLEPSSANDRVLQATSKTNKQGVARTMVKLSCVPGDRVITASADGVRGSAVVHVDLGRHGNAGTNLSTVKLKSLANASPVVAQKPKPTAPMPVVLLAFAAVSGSALLLRRVIARR